MDSCKRQWILGISAYLCYHIYHLMLIVICRVNQKRYQATKSIIIWFMGMERRMQVDRKCGYYTICHYWIKSQKKKKSHLKVSSHILKAKVNLGKCEYENVSMSIYMIFHFQETCIYDNQIDKNHKKFPGPHLTIGYQTKFQRKGQLSVRVKSKNFPNFQRKNAYFFIFEQQMLFMVLLCLSMRRRIKYKAWPEIQTPC